MPALFHLDVRLQFPFPISLTYHRVFLDTNRRAQIESLMRTVEALLKYLTFVGLADLFQCIAQKPGGTLVVNGPLHFLQKGLSLTIGQWKVALREVARRLSREDAGARVVRELPGACAEGTDFDRLMGDILGQRNDWTHDEHMMTLTDDEADELFRYVHPRLLSALWKVEFLAQYVLGFARTLVRQTSSAAILRFHACAGHRVATGQDDTFPAKLPVKPDVPFLVTPDHGRVLYLWPFLAPKECAPIGRPTLYAFTKIPDRGEYLSHVKLAALDARETWSRDLGAASAADFVWLIDRIRTEYLPTPVPASVKLGERLRRRTNESLVGRTLGEYTLTAWLGAGGNGTVYAATDPDGNTAAVKVLNTTDDDEQITRFEQEFRKMQELPHPGVIRVFTCGGDMVEERVYVWFAMEFADRGTLADRAASRKPDSGKPWDDPDHRNAIIDEFRAVASAVAHLHGNGLIHRDIKPANVLVMDDGSLRLTDFGLAKSLTPSEYTRKASPQSLSGIGLGTLHYMAPEQERGEREKVGKPADVYALCIVLAELVLGVRPSHDLRALTGSTLDGTQEVKSLPNALAQFILKGTAVEPRLRFPDASAALEAFELDVADGSTR